MTLTGGARRQMRLSCLPPLMVYMTAGMSGLTGIVGTFFIKDYLGLPAEFLAMLGFWVGLPCQRGRGPHLWVMNSTRYAIPMLPDLNFSQ